MKPSSCGRSASSSAWVRSSTRGCCSISRAVASALPASSSARGMPRNSVLVMDGASVVVIVEDGADMGHGEVMRIVRAPAFAQGAKGVGQVLADQRDRCGVRAQVGKQTLACCLDRRIRPVVADPVAEAVVQVDAELVAFGVVVALPVLRF